MMDVNDRLCTDALDAALQGLHTDLCVFCDIAAAPQRHRAVAAWDDAVAIVPLNPKADGHVMVIPKQHVVHAALDPAVFARCAHLAAEIAEPYPAYNIITSAGAAATQSVMHLHVHVVPRSDGDGIALAGGPGWPHCACGNALDSRLVTY